MWKKIKLGSIASAVSAVAYLLYCVFQAKDDRLAHQPPAIAPVSFTVDEAVPVKVELSATSWLGDVIYLNGKRIPADAYGMATFTAADLQANPQLLGDHSVAVEDFPIVAFYNSSAFDVTGAFLIVRRAADGEMVSEIELRPESPVRKVYPHRQGGYHVWYGNGAHVWATTDEWQRRYMGVTPQEAVPTPQPSMKMPTLEELKHMVLDEPEPERGG